MTYCYNETNFTLIDDGTLDTVIECTACETEIRFADTAVYRDGDAILDLDRLVDSEDMEHEIPERGNE